MHTYTVKLEADSGLYLLDDKGERREVISLLDVFGDRRVVILDAPMGTGKTTLIKSLCEQMGTEDVVNSPTFAIVNVYDTNHGEVYHFDCYRLKDIREVYDMGAEDYLYSGNWCFIEWPDIMSPILPDDVVTVTIRTTAGGDRVLTVN